MGLVFRYTHDLEELGTGLETSGGSILPIVKEAVILAEAVVTWADGIVQVK